MPDDDGDSAAYHAAAAALLGYAFAPLPQWIAVLAFILEALVIISAMPIGGHYLVDVLAGIALAVGSLAIVHAYANAGDRSRFGATSKTRSDIVRA